MRQRYSDYAVQGQPRLFIWSGKWRTTQTRKTRKTRKVCFVIVIEGNRWIFFIDNIKEFAVEEAAYLLKTRAVGRHAL